MFEKLVEAEKDKNVEVAPKIVPPPPLKEKKMLIEIPEDEN